ncbi:large ribosomal subunit protein uL30-like isoform X1 [Watersipora subatra]|uniref:large ribosomal subunit protein uL30-like isoform X1 n=1 Tax=Watersipora subatra TaxID=2589382 RepID=UPI00355B0137
MYAMEGEELPRVKENILKKRRRNLEAKALRDKEISRKLKGRLWSKKTFFRRAERFVKENKKAERHNVRVQREFKKPEKLKTKPRGDLAFVLRIRGVRDTPEKANKLLNLLRLAKQEEGVFLRLNKTTTTLLAMVDPYITWGHPNLRIVKDLIFKRGHGKVGGRQRGPLSDNTQIEKYLGKYNVVCLEDIVHEIFTADSTNFTQVNDFLHHFKLGRPVGGWRHKNKHFKDGGDFGCRHDKINDLLKSII